jgi:hypothetical protein
MAVAVKYTPEVRNKIENPGKIPKNERRNVVITIPQTMKLPNWVTMIKYMIKSENIIASPRSRKVSIVSFHSPPQISSYFFPVVRFSKTILYGEAEIFRYPLLSNFLSQNIWYRWMIGYTTELLPISP